MYKLLFLFQFKQKVVLKTYTINGYGLNLVIKIILVNLNDSKFNDCVLS